MGKDVANHFCVVDSCITAEQLWQSDQVVNDSAFTIKVVNTYAGKRMFTTAYSPAVK